MSEKISVIVPVYNVEDYLEECVNSLLRQTYQNIEILLINDGSTDRSGEICDSYQSSKIIVYHKPNGGLSSARNYGIERASGSYICFIDSDDYIEPRYLENLLHAILKADNNCALAMCRFTRTVGDFDNDVPEPVIMRSGEVLERILYQNDDLLFSIAACNKLYHSSVFEKLRFPEGKLNEDMFVICETMNLTSIVAVLDFKGYYYRVNQTSITQKRFSHKNMDVLEACDHIMEYVNDHRDLNSMKIAAVNLKFRRSFQMLYKLWQSHTDAPEDEKILYDNLRQMASDIRSDRNAKKSTKLAAYATLLGKNLLRILVHLKYGD